jgi:hypothetical protein
MNKRLLVLAFLLTPILSYSAQSTDADSFVSDVKKAAETDVSCPAPSASGTFLLTKATYDFGKSMGVYVFKNGPNAKLDWIGAKNKGDDFSSEEIVGFEFGFTMPNGQFFLTINKNGKIKAGVNVNGTSGVKEISCKLVSNG